MEEGRTALDDIRNISPEEQRAVQYAANYETIRINRWVLWNDMNQMVAGLDTTSQDLDLEVLKSGWTYIINNITAIEEGTKPTTIELGFVRSGHFQRLTWQTPSNNDDSVDWTGQLVLRETDVIRARFKGATAANTIYLYANGYKVKR